jgi:hypothetical protein
LLRIFNLFLKAKTVPESEKEGILTALPKSEGAVTDTDNIRPITVGTAVNRLIHKILARRLSSTIASHDKLKSQFAFVPGRDIHEPISTAIECYRDSEIHKKDCFAIYYDISKAYDSIRWSTIRSALHRIGAPQAFIDFVLNSLEGTTTAARTNKPGHITPSVKMSKGIRQGCPLAPLLFVIVMDELHTSLASCEGYTLGANNSGPTIQSRGYCDDTWIISSTTSGLKKMNSIVQILY